MAQREYVSGILKENEFLPGLGRSVCLWSEQAKVLSQQNLHWNSVALEDLVRFTPSVFQPHLDSVLEGVRDIERVQNGSGWILYTDNDTQNNLPYISAKLHQLLEQFNVNILRFLALPDGWTFNIQPDGTSYVWEEELS